MLKVKHLTLFKPKIEKKAGILTDVIKNQNFVLYRMQLVLGR